MMKKGKTEDAERNEETPTESQVTWVLIWTVLATAIGSGFQHGYNIGVLNTPQNVFESWMNSTMELSETQLTALWSATTSILCIGGILGGAMTGALSKNFGRRRALIVNNFIAVIAAISSGGAQFVGSPFMLILGRFVIGINAGLNAGIGIMYLSEIAPTRLRGAVGTTYLACMTTSILISNLLGGESVFGTDSLWPLLFFITVIPAVYQSLALLIAPESPKYLLEIGEEALALSASIKLCGALEGAKNIKTMEAELAEAKSEASVTIKTMLQTLKYRRPLIIVSFLMAAQQFSGINAVTFYSTYIFQMAQLSETHSQVATIGVALVNVITTIASLLLVDVIGRRPLLIFGFGGMALVTSLLTICLCVAEKHVIFAYAAVAFVYLYVILFAIGPGAVPWIVGPELFLTAIRPLGMSIASPINWLSNFIVGILFLPLQNIMGPYVFAIFVISTALSTVYFYVKLPETKNRPIDEIAATFE